MKDTQQRILDAALKVFSRDGFAGATTREIARVAKVNEVTLFRYFKNKNELLKQAVMCSASRYEHVFAEASLDSPEAFRRTVVSYAEAYAKKLRENEDMVRTFIGEMTRHLKLWRMIFAEGAKLSRDKFIAYLKSAQKAGLVRKDLDAETATDAFSGMLMTGALRRPLTESLYSAEKYTETCIALFLKGIEK